MSCARISLTFEVAGHLPDTPEYARLSSAEHVERTLKFRTATQTYAARLDAQAYWADYAQTRWMTYLLESLVDEGCVTRASTIDDIEAILVGTAPSSSAGEQLKVRSLHNGMLMLFDPKTLGPLEGIRDAETLSSAGISKLHAAVCENLMPAADLGAFRTKHAKPAHEDWLYLAPHLIARNLETLCKQTVGHRARLEAHADPADKLLETVKLAAAFLASFLQIHPFKNGNGRVARLLASYILRDVSVVPVPLTAKVNGRETYLECLRDARRYSNGDCYVPRLLARFVLEAVHNIQNDAIATLDLSFD